jgi:glucuronate isomerase
LCKGKAAGLKPEKLQIKKTLEFEKGMNHNMKSFMDEDFLLTTETAKRLYHDYAEAMPIIDYHCHIDPQQIAEDHQFSDIAEAWLGGDHYKWRAIRSNGIEEEEITGSAPARVKFQRWAETMPKAVGNPLYHWTHLELKRYFDVSLPLNGDTAKTIWNQCNEKLQQKDFSVRGIIKKSNVEVICTTDDPADSLIWHQKIREDSGFSVKVLPAFRPDQAVNLEKPGFLDYLTRLGNAVGYELDSAQKVMDALKQRLNYFVENGCKVSDHGLDQVPCEDWNMESVEQIFQKRLAEQPLTQKEADQYKTAVLSVLAKEYHRLGIVMQIHYGAQRNLNTRLYEKLGPDTGFDAIQPVSCAAGLSRFLDALDRQNSLPKTILYSLNPHDNELLGSIIGAFQGTEVPGKVQLGSAWWYNDHKTGMTKQLTDLANLSLLGNFVGMLTDSRSFLSYTRHEYFRRILCELLGSWAENGECPCDLEWLGKMVQDISYYNAKRYFGF